MYRLAILLALFALFAVGCGGGESDDKKSAVPAATAQVRPDKDVSASNDKKPSPPREDGDKDEEESQAEEPVAQEDPDGHDEEPAATGAELRALIRLAATNALRSFELEVESVDIRDGGRRVTVTVTRASACNAVARYEVQMGELIKHSVPTVKSVTFMVAGTGQELGYYVVDCAQPEMPDGPGRVVLEREGVNGPIYTRRFTIRSDRWSLEWENGGNHLAIIVTALGGESKGEYKDPLGVTKRGSGRKLYRGAGVYNLQIDGSGSWGVRVKDLGK